MYLLFETIRLENGKLRHLPWHQQRVNRSFQDLLPGLEPLNLERVIRIPPFARKGLYKCRVTYGKEAEKIEFLPYERKKISSLKLLETNGMEYSYKFADRTAIDNYFQKRGEAEDILFMREGNISDTSIANVAFLKKGKWLTPAHPLLQGTCLSRLLEKELVSKTTISKDELHEFEKIRVFNAMTGWKNAWELDTSSILSE